jgi:capsular polysaccharide biosynthesis protein
VLDAGLPGWWILITGAADILALAILLSPRIRRWVAKKAAPVP